jgi:hypothetical protein
MPRSWYTPADARSLTDTKPMRTGSKLASTVVALTFRVLVIFVAGLESVKGFKRRQVR